MISRNVRVDLSATIMEKNIRRLFKNNDKFLKTSKHIFLISHICHYFHTKINVGWAEQGSQDQQRPANIVYGG